jgi:hypothetical protein
LDGAAKLRKGQSGREKIGCGTSDFAGGHGGLGCKNGAPQG